jgi:hypothetical protein
MVELFLDELVPELRRSFFTVVVVSPFATSEMVELLLFRGAGLLLDCDEWSWIDSRILSNLRFLVSMAYMLA